jgi:hypothetical protein
MYVATLIPVIDEQGTRANQGFFLLYIGHEVSRA